MHLRRVRHEGHRYAILIWLKRQRSYILRKMPATEHPMQYCASSQRCLRPSSLIAQLPATLLLCSRIKETSMFSSYEYFRHANFHLHFVCIKNRKLYAACVRNTLHDAHRTLVVAATDHQYQFWSFSHASTPEWCNAYLICVACRHKCQYFNLYVLFNCSDARIFFLQKL